MIQRIPTVLLVEDNSFDEKITLRALRECKPPPKIEVVRTGPAALEYFFGQKKGQIPALILLDLRLPIIDGLQVLERLRAERETRHIPIVVLTCSESAPDVSRAYALGANSYVRKPSENARYAEVVKMLGDYWLETNKRSGIR